MGQVSLLSGAPRVSPGQFLFGAELLNLTFGHADEYGIAFLRIGRTSSCDDEIPLIGDCASLPPRILRSSGALQRERE
ncbi:hypothetical protein [Streptomyces sp. NPDC051218]|uniref:hypothetical protein n=1 Tax=Streptomyces sp. NPDC051218 TaxID=3365645 RepID=UPI00379B7F08